MLNQAYWMFLLINNWERLGILEPDEHLRKKKSKHGQSHRVRTEKNNTRRAISYRRCGQEGYTRRSRLCPQQDH